MQKPAKCFQVLFHILEVTLGTSLPLYHHTPTHNYMGGVGTLGPLLFPGRSPWE